MGDSPCSSASSEYSWTAWRALQQMAGLKVISKEGGAAPPKTTMGSHLMLNLPRSGRLYLVAPSGYSQGAGVARERTQILPTVLRLLLSRIVMQRR